MLGPSGFFCFSHVVAQGQGQSRRFAFAYKPPGPVQRGALDDLMAAMCRGPNIPDAVIVLSLTEDSDGDLSAQLRADTSRLAQQRLLGRIPLLRASFSLKSGAVALELLDPTFKSLSPMFRQVIVDRADAWLKSGLCTVFEPEHVVLRAPPGYSYQKPSGARSEWFLKPDLGLKSSASVALVALALFRKLYANRVHRFAELETVFVDTMAVSPVAYALRDLLGLCGFARSFHIESFHSYGGLEGVKRPLPNTSLCLISASSSMSMHEQWITQKGVGRDEVVTLLTFESAGKRAAGALLALESPQEKAAPGSAQFSIRIKGETFLPEQEPAKKVLLSDQVHRSDSEVAHFREFAGRGVFDIHRRPGGASSKVRALFVDGEALIQEHAFQVWLETQLLQSIKAATQVIVWQPDTPSRRLAGMVELFCRKRLSLSGLRLMSVPELANASLESAAGVVVCAAVAGKGSQLLEVSRMLRDKHDGPRLYLVGYQVAETRGELGALRANLIHSKSVPYDFGRFGGAAIGTALATAFEYERQTYYDLSTDTSSLPGSMRQRARVLGSTGPVGGLALLPHGAKVDGPMRLRSGFAYWPDGYTPEAFHPEVLATVAVLLQRARELDKLPDERRLSTSSYRHVVLDPENFARFNDGVLQAALLRCAHPAELDYRADHAASDFMKALILRALARATEEAGEAALEFLLALATRRLQLAEPHLEEVQAAALGGKDRPAPLRRAFEYLLKSSAGRRQAKRRLPF
jgi:hypothetical protein